MKKRSSKKLVSKLILLLLFVTTSPTYPAPVSTTVSPPATLYDAANQKLDALLIQLPEIQKLANGEQSYVLDKPYTAAIAKILDENTNLQRLSRGIMGEHYKEASDLQRKRFYSKLRFHLVEILASGLEKVDFSSLIRPKIVLPQQHESRRDNEVNIEFTRSNRATVSVLLSVIPPSENSELQIVNVVVMGINFGIILRHQFSAAYYLTGGNLDTVITTWKPFAI